MRNLTLPLPTSLALLALVLFAGCSSNSTSSTSADGPQLRLNATLATSNTLQKAVQSDSLVISEVKLLVDEIEFERDDDSMYDEFETGPLVVTLNANAPVSEIALSNIPAGIYDEIEFDIDSGDDHPTLSDTDFLPDANSDDGYSIIVRGTLRGQAFLFRTDEDFEIELEFDRPIQVMDDGIVDLTLSIDPMAWFKTSNGTLLDPTDASNQSRIEAAIERSFDVFEDSDRDGEDDYDDDEYDDDEDDD
ncbi:MAG: hypothetical protein AAFW89_08260 [Bacteroidota bacterium]